MSDITRFAHDRHEAWQAQFLLPVCITLTEVLGGVLAASAQVIYGKVLWNPLDVVSLWDNRAGKFFAGLLFAFANIITNVAGNSVPFANDLMGFFPKLVNIRRGQIVCAILGFAICPWLIQAKAERFLGFLNGYTVFLGPLIGILVADYWLVCKGKGFMVRSLYQAGGKNILYWYTAAINCRAIVALFIGIVPLLPGLAHNINPNLSVSRGAQAYCSMSWLIGCVQSLVSYYLLYLVSPWQLQLGEEVILEGESGDIETGAETPPVKEKDENE